MTPIDDVSTRVNVVNFLTVIKEEQAKLEEKSPKKIIFSILDLEYAVKNKIALVSLLTHKLVLSTRLFYEDQTEVKTDESVLELLKRVLEYELSSDLKITTIGTDDIRKIIKATHSIENRIFKKRNKGPKNEL